LNYATAHQWYGIELELTGKFDEALQEMKLASYLDPLSLIIIKDTGEIYYVARKYDRAIEYFRKALEMDPNFVVAHMYLGLAYAQQQEFSRALAELQKARLLQDSPDILSELGYVYALSGKRKEAQEKLSDLRGMSKQRYVDPTCYANIYAGLGDKDRAIEWLEEGYREEGLLAGLKVDPDWDNLRTDSRFADLMKRVRLAP
jgi:tetratricopeptide (TPR) repeat protein